MADLAALTVEDFAPLVGDRFHLTPAGGDAVAVTLREATPGPVPPAGYRRPFSLVFDGPPAPLLTQGTHRVEHASLGTLELFLVPIRPGADGASRYEAVFA